MNASTSHLCQAMVNALLRGELTAEQLHRGMMLAYEQGNCDAALAAAQALKGTFGDEAKQAELRG